jgi:outer membrane receptor for ferrienterochelin and colicins
MTGRRALFAVRFVLPGLLFGVSSAALGANEDPDETAIAGRLEAARIFLPAEFAGFAPRTALDMLRQVPGFAIQGQSQQRGLGQASGNVLINGQRSSGKSNDATAEVARIPAAAVVRIEIVDGATLNIAGLSGQVANVITRPTGLSGQFQWRGEARARNTEPLFTNGSASLSGALNQLSYTIGVRNEAFRQGNAGPTRIFNAAGDLIDFRQEQALFSGDRPRISAGLNYGRQGGLVANLNLSYQMFWFDQLETSERSGIGLPDRSRRLTVEQNRHGYEAGGDVEFGVGSGRLKLIGLQRFEHAPSDSRLVTNFADASPASGSRFLRIADETETVGRA